MLLHNLITLDAQGRFKRTFPGGGRLWLNRHTSLFYIEFIGLYLGDLHLQLRPQITCG